MIVISDSSVFVALQHLKLISLLPGLYSTVILPNAVHEELVEGKIFSNPEIEALEFLHTYTVINKEKTTELCKILDRGEAEAIVAYIECNADLLLIDELDGRREAMKLGIAIKGTLGILADAKSKGLIQEVMPLIKILKNELRFRISEDVEIKILRQANEK
jgi:uncharacterized protein